MSGTDEHGFPSAAGFPAIDAPGMTGVDLPMVHSCGITLPHMMENARRAPEIVARLRYLPGDMIGGYVVVLAGSRGNRGGAMVAARRLAALGCAGFEAAVRQGH